MTHHQKPLRTRRWMVSAGLGLIALHLSISTPVLSGQAHFELPNREIQYETYPAIWECRAAIHRILDSTRKTNPVWRDTLPWASGEERIPLPDIAVQVAQRCGAPNLTADPNALGEWIELLLVRNDQTGLTTVIREAVLEKSYQTNRDALERMQEVLQAYRDVPQRDILAISIVQTFMAQRAMSPDERTLLWGTYLDAALARGDHSLAEVAGGRIVTLIDSLVAEDYDGSELRGVVLAGLEAKYERELLDSLKQGGTASYTRFRNTVFEPAVRRGWVAPPERDGTVRSRIGGQVAAVQAAYWYPEKPATDIPVRGQVSLLVFLDISSYYGITGFRESFDFFATLRRLKQQFPALDITIVSRTLGWFGHGPPLNVQDEGLVLRKWLLDARQLPARLAIDSTPSYRLPGLDRRRVNLASANDENFALGIAMRSGLGNNDQLRRSEKAYLVDAEGTIIHVGELKRKYEKKYAEMIEALLRDRTGGS